jgi:Holliday junction resolvase RusA-like endonuclease
MDDGAPSYAHQVLLWFRVLGKPITQGSVKNYGRGKPSAYTNEKDLLPWREQIQHAAEAAVDALTDQEIEFPVTGPVGLVCHFTVSKPTTAPKTKTTYPTPRPDASKLFRAVEDALVAAGVYKDDAQIVSGAFTKSYPKETMYALHVPGVQVTVYQVDLPQGDPPGTGMR